MMDVYTRLVKKKSKKSTFRAWRKEGKLEVLQTCIKKLFRLKKKIIIRT